VCYNFDVVSLFEGAKFTLPCSSVGRASGCARAKRAQKLDSQEREERKVTVGR